MLERVLILAAFCLPLALGLVQLAGRLPRSVERMAPWAGVPALLLAVIASPHVAVELPGFLLGARFGIDSVGRVFLLFSALLWLSAGLYARAYMAHDAARHRFSGFFLVTMCGNLGLIVARDAATFYLFFALMTFAGYGLVVHDGSAQAIRAGRLYLTLAVIGEVGLVTALFLATAGASSLDFADVGAAVAVSPTRDAVVLLALVGFGIKAGVLPLHVWLPLAHPIAPTPASAVLSGAMIKAGLLGWLRLLPLGAVVVPGWGAFWTMTGLLAALYGVAVGLAQANPKTVLAYSSISQMGFMTVAVGSGLAAPEHSAAALLAALAYAFHHGIAKGALFLGVGVASACGGRTSHRRMVLAGLLLPALALAGAPWTSGALAKLALKDAVAATPVAASRWILLLLPLAAAGTTLLMARFLWLLTRPSGSAVSHPSGRRLVASWVVLLLAVLFAGDLMEIAGLSLPGKGTRTDAPWADVTPILVGLIAALGLRAWVSGGPRYEVRIPEGDLLVWAAALWRHAIAFRSAGGKARTSGFSRIARGFELIPQASAAAGTHLGRVETQLRHWPVFGSIFLFALATLLALLWTA